MIEDFYFLDEGKIKITAASVGIGKSRWTSIQKEDISVNKVCEIMKYHRFDHLPIITQNGAVTEYFKTDLPNKYDKISQHKINFTDIIALDTNIRIVIEKFANEGRSFYFLNYHNNITGLITLGNLNCRQVQVFLFSLICELERELGEFINSCLSNNIIKSWTQEKANNDNPKSKYSFILKNYDNLVNLDLENKLTEHFFLLDFFKIIKDNNLFVNLDYTKAEWDELKSINELRNRIAHPTRSLLDEESTIIRLNKRITKIEDLIFRLSIYKKNDEIK